LDEPELVPPEVLDDEDDEDEDEDDCFEGWAV
jgi:hypothetical protein